MKIASLRSGSRDGRLALVSSDLTLCTDAAFLAGNLQAALDNWSRLSSHLEALAESLGHGAVPAERFHEHDAAAPLPRAYHHQGQGGLLASGAMSAARDPYAASAGEDCQTGFAVITTDVPQGVSSRDAASLAVLVMLAAGSRLDLAFSPAAVTPGELGAAWRDGKLTLALAASHNGKPLQSSAETIDFAALIAAAAQHRPLGAGTVISASAGPAVALKPGDTLRLAAKDARGHTIFGAIERQAAS